MKQDLKITEPNEKSTDTHNADTTTPKCNSDLAEFTDIVGGSGKWQIKLLIISACCGVSAAWNHLAISFLAFPVDHWCAAPKDTNISQNAWLQEYLPNTTIKGISQHSQCEKFVIDNITSRPIITKTESCSSWEFANDYNSIVNQWDLVCDQEWMISTSQSVYMLGFLFAVTFSGQISDVYGRFPAVMMNVVILLVSGVAVAFAKSIIVFTVFRFFVAVGQSGLNLVSFIILIEGVASPHRAKLNLLSSFGWHAGYLTYPLMAWLLKDWFLLQLAITLPCLAFIAFYWIVPESPRWLLSKGKLAEALPILDEAASLNGIEVKDLEAKAKAICITENQDKHYSSNVTIIDLLRTPNLRKKTLCLYFTWVVIAFVYYGLSLNTNDLQGNDYVNFTVSGVMEIPATIFCIFAMDILGRRKPLILSLLIGGVSCFACMFVPESLSILKIVFAMIGKMLVTASFSIVYIYSAEIFPTVARNIGVGSSSTMARIGSSVAPFMRDLGKVTSPSLPLGIFGVLSIISSALIVMLPETNKCPVPETLEQAENFGKKDKKAESEVPFKLTRISSN